MLFTSPLHPHPTLPSCLTLPQGETFLFSSCCVHPTTKDLSKVTSVSGPSPVPPSARTPPPPESGCTMEWFCVFLEKSDKDEFMRK